MTSLLPLREGRRGPKTKHVVSGYWGTSGAYDEAWHRPIRRPRANIMAAQPSPSKWMSVITIPALVFVGLEPCVEMRVVRTATNRDSANEAR